MKILITGHKEYIGSKLFTKLNNETNIVHGIGLKDGKDVFQKDNLCVESLAQ